MHQSIFRPVYIFNNDAYFLDFRAQKFPLIFKPFSHQQALHFGVLNYKKKKKKKQHKEGTCTVLGRSVVFSAFYADFCFCSKSVIITTLMLVFLKKYYMLQKLFIEIKLSLLLLVLLLVFCRSCLICNITRKVRKYIIIYQTLSQHSYSDLLTHLRKYLSKYLPSTLSL